MFLWRKKTEHNVWHRAARLWQIIIVDYSLETVIAIINNDYFEPYFYIKYIF